MYQQGGIYSGTNLVRVCGMNIDVQVCGMNTKGALIWYEYMRVSFRANMEWYYLVWIWDSVIWYRYRVGYLVILIRYGYAVTLFVGYMLADDFVN